MGLYHIMFHRDICVDLQIYANNYMYLINTIVDLLFRQYVMLPIKNTFMTLAQMLSKRLQPILMHIQN